MQVPGTDARIAHDPRSDDPLSGTQVQQGDEVEPGDQALSEAQQKKDEFATQAQVRTREHLCKWKLVDLSMTSYRRPRRSATHKTSRSARVPTSPLKMKPMYNSARLVSKARSRA